MLLQLVKRSTFVKNTATLVIGTIIAQAIPLILHPFLRRIYSPEDFGAMAVYLNIIGILIIVTSLRYEAAIVLPNRKNEAANVFFASVFFNLIFCLVIFVAILLFKNSISVLINFPVKFSSYLYFLPLGLFLLSFYNSINFWLIREKAFKASAINKLSRRGVEGIGQSSLGYLGVSSGLIIGDIAGNIANVISGLIQMEKTKFSFFAITKKRIVFVVKKYKDFPLYNLFPSLLSAAGSMLPILFINKIYSSEAVGFIDLSRMVLSIPLAFLSVTIAQVIFQHISEKYNNRQSVKPLLWSVFKFLLLISVLEIVVIQLFGPYLFGFVFGDKYVVSGEYSRILVFSFVLNFIMTSFSSIFIAFNQLKLIAVWQIAYFFAICSLLLFKNIPLYTFVNYYVLIEVLMYSIYIFMTIYVIKKYEQKLV